MGYRVVMTRHKVLFQHFSGGTEEDLKGSQDNWPQAIYFTCEYECNLLNQKVQFSCCLQIIVSSTRTVFCI